MNDNPNTHKQIKTKYKKMERPLANWWSSNTFSDIPMASSLATVLTNTEDILPVSQVASACSSGTWWSMCDWSQMGGIGPAFSLYFVFFFCFLCVLFL